jgi:hypothetical protein
LAEPKRKKKKDAQEQPQEEAQEPTYEEIAERAYHLSESGEGGTAEENWRRAEEELRRERGGGEGPWAKVGSGDVDNVTDS